MPVNNQAVKMPDGSIFQGNVRGDASGQQTRYKAENRAPGVNVVVDTCTGYLLTTADAGPILTYGNLLDAQQRADQMNSEARR